MRALLERDIAAVEEGWRGGHRELATIYAGGMKVLVAGGATRGDHPSQAYESLGRFQGMSLVKAAGSDLQPAGATVAAAGGIAMMSILDGSANATLALVEQGLREVGYANGLLRRDYAFADLLTASTAVRRVPLAAFGQEPPSYRTACFGVVIGRPGVDVSAYRALGAPQLLELTEGDIRRWKVTAYGET